MHPPKLVTDHFLGEPFNRPLANFASSPSLNRIHFLPYFLLYELQGIFPPPGTIVPNVPKL